MNQSFVHDASITSSFKPISSVAPTDAAPALKAVVLGGGTGANVSIRTLLSLGCSVDAVVAMADDGGSTGILRQQAHATAPGDIRKCIGALAADSEDALTKAFKYRFPFADGHTLGNLMLAALEDATGSFPQAVAICEKLLNARGHAYPSTVDSVSLCARTCGGIQVMGQAHASSAPEPLDSVWLQSDGPCHAYPPAEDAIRNADLVILGPGSLFTSIIPNILVPGIVEAIRDSQAYVVFVCGVADVQGETRGLSARQHVEALLRHGMEGLVDCVLLHAASPVLVRDDAVSCRQMLSESDVASIDLSQEDVSWIKGRVGSVLVRNLVNPQRPQLHDPAALQQAFSEVITICLSPRR